MISELVIQQSGHVKYYHTSTEIYYHLASYTLSSIFNVPCGISSIETYLLDQHGIHCMHHSDFPIENSVKDTPCFLHC